MPGKGVRQRLSQHPVDVLIREVIRTERPVTKGEINRIFRHIREAPFPTVMSHLDKRIREGQWSETVDTQVYDSDLRRAIEDPEAHLVVYMRRGGYIAGVLTLTERAVPESHQGAEALPLIYVVYSADRGIIVTGYQASHVDQIDIPEGARWLK